jgi:hypothetical protein
VLHTPNNLAFGVWRENHAKLFGVWRFAPRQIIWCVGVLITPTKYVAFGVLACWCVGIVFGVVGVVQP